MDNTFDCSKATLTIDGKEFPVTKCEVNYAASTKDTVHSLHRFTSVGVLTMSVSLDRRQKRRMQQWLEKVLETTKKETA